MIIDVTNPPAELPPVRQENDGKENSRRLQAILDAIAENAAADLPDAIEVVNPDEPPEL